jgi:replicative DNA helicase
MTYSTGIPELDRLLGGGLRPGSFTLVAGISQSGMTTMLDTIVRSAAFNNDTPTMLVDCEASRWDRARRLLSAMSGIELTKLQRRNRLTADEHAWLRSVADVARDAPLFQSEARTLAGIEASMNRASRPPALLVADGARYLDYDYDDCAASHDAQVAVRLQELAVRRSVAVVMSAPLSGDAYERQPALADLPDGLAFTPSNVVFVHRPELLNANDRPGEADLIVAKARRGTAGVVTVAAEAGKARFLPSPWPRAA